MDYNYPSDGSMAYAPAPAETIGTNQPPCCDRAIDPYCMDPCPGAPPPAQSDSFEPDPGEITFKLYQTWDSDKFSEKASPPFQILSGNVEKAIKSVLGDDTQVSNVFFSQGYVP
ncbi:hypothetical protein, partial [Salmonella sp. s51090]|uniref:hypothetical protein n=1 Tax=Salmonella sp. s51090 TaxID=3159651 RepID=UPI00397FD02B